MLLIYNQQSEIFDRGEDGRARSNHNTSFPFLDTVPLVIAFTVTQAAVEDGDLLTKTPDEPGRGLRGQRDFWNQDDDRFSVFEEILPSPACRPPFFRSRLRRAGGTSAEVLPGSDFGGRGHAEFPKTPAAALDSAGAVGSARWVQRLADSGRFRRV